MKFIVLRTSPTGKKLAEVANKISEALEAQKKLARKWGFKEWRNEWGPVAAGGISSMTFPNGKEPDKKDWKNVNGSKHEWMPKHSTKKGAELNNELKKLPIVYYKDVNSIVGFDEYAFSCIGFNFNGNKKYFGISAKDDWDIKATKDLKEVTVAEYKKLFNEND